VPNDKPLELDAAVLRLDALLITQPIALKD